MTTTVLDLQRFKEEGQRFAMLTCYDYPTAQVLDEAGIPVVLVGDTLGIFVLGYETTLPVTMDEVVHHTRAVRRGLTKALLVADLPFGAYQASLADGVANAVRLVKEGGAAVVKLEGAEVELVSTLTSKGVPVMAHLGLTPQSFHELGGNRVQARTEKAVLGLLADARRLEEAGACAVVLEAVPSEAARRVTEALSIPTIGIGAGPHCDGQVLVSTEMFGLSSGHQPRFVKRYADLRSEMAAAAKAFAEDVASGGYPDAEHSYDWEIRPTE
ncbi:MAG: 3-methyl-2-oxobutanoate hydroxymethyltransferase [Acidimicrobiaceae bacterium]|nr:3-methyl-2-oxobutanoate hydroxymethyltransferase [Acidimicrobiaceae bacterium]